MTSGPTHEPIDPVRYIANRSSGKQGHAIAAAAAAAGADVVLVRGPVDLSDPTGVKTVKVETAREMFEAVETALPADCAISRPRVRTGAWRNPAARRSRRAKAAPQSLRWWKTRHPGMTVAHRETQRPRLVIGFAAETEKVIANAKAKLARKGCDWILANDVSAESGVMGGDMNTIHLVTADGVEPWPPQSKEEVARTLIGRIAAALGSGSP